MSTFFLSECPFSLIMCIPNVLYWNFNSFPLKGEFVTNAEHYVCCESWANSFGFLWISSNRHEFTWISVIYYNRHRNNRSFFELRRQISFRLLPFAAAIWSGVHPNSFLALTLTLLSMSLLTFPASPRIQFRYQSLQDFFLFH